MTLHINSEELRGHSNKVAYIAEEVASASKASGATMDSEAFGVICSFMVPSLTQVKEAVESAIETTHVRLEKSVTHIRASAEEFEASDAVNGGQLGTVEQGLHGSFGRHL